MIPGWVLLLVSAGYVCLLFAVAYAGVRAKRNPPGGGFLSWEELDTQTSVCEKMPDKDIRG